MKNAMKIRGILLIYVFIAVAVFFFYLNFINLSTDTILLFVSQKIFLGKWLAKGILPFFNPHIYAGIPFLFDPGMGHLHPINLFFILPYPFSFAFWTGVMSFVFLTGFYLFFLKSGRDNKLALIFTLILFFSGSGLLRLNNPTIFAVISHYGFFLFALSRLHNKKGGYLLPLAAGVLLTLAGHLQFVVYGYILGFIVLLFHYRVPLIKAILFFCMLLFLVSWYFVFSLPLVLSSTRIGAGADYANIGPINPIQIGQLVLPFFLGFVRNGSSWNAGPTAVLLFSFVGTLFFTVQIFRGKIQREYIPVFLVLIALSLGFVTIPFFRGAGQIWIIIHILMLVVVSENKVKWYEIFQNNFRPLYLSIGILGFVSFAFFASPLFSLLFLKAYSFLKHGAVGLFFDRPTVAAIGVLFSLSFILAGIFGWAFYAGSFFKKKAMFVLFAYIVLEGLIVNFYHGYFIPSSVLNENIPLPNQVDTVSYRVQSTMDVIPYTGFHTYMGSLLFRPPFSKEKPIIDSDEEKTFAKLKNTFSYIPSSWSMVAGTYAVQGYNTFVPGRIAKYFTPVSSDYKTEYDYIIARNAEFTDTTRISHINALDTSRITMQDPRWQKLAVRYFISDRPLRTYSLVEKDGNRFYYENTNALSIYRYIDKSNKIQNVVPLYADPNQMIFDVTKADIGKKLEIVINPDGFLAMINGKQINTEKDDFNLTVPLTDEGNLKVYYSPLKHLKEVTLKYFSVPSFGFR